MIWSFRKGNDMFNLYIIYFLQIRNVPSWTEFTGAAVARVGLLEGHFY
ncbi:hypothetical protein [Entomobacter blattae]|uniref:Uncharacterized protein n=1 Tax=Entomobacter blattae TaxID=2762277 RepID=A0A7H1NR67_9PROT|nr:hypothetical protein [Entomobacter blattae]QNT78277.1 hypothetical protein JGUZn3_10490 [Entomobacter blattae]